MPEVTEAAEAAEAAAPLDPPPREYLYHWPWRQAPRGPASGLDNIAANVPDSFEQFLLAKDEKKVEMKLDTR